MSRVDLSEFLSGFLAEAEEHLQSINSNLMLADAAIRRREPSPRAVRDLFRSLHTIKGLAGMVGVEPIVELAHVLGMTAVAEGVETAEQHQLLASIGCDFCQGFYFAHPLPPDDLDALASPGMGIYLPVLPLEHTRRAG